MAPRKRRPPWIVRSLITLTIIMVAAVLWHNWTRHPAEALVATPPTAPPARVCVTRGGFCPVGLVRAGDPCSCPDNLDGNVPGYVELVRGGSAQRATRTWPTRDEPDRDEADPLESLSPHYGP